MKQAWVTFWWLRCGKKEDQSTIHMLEENNKMESEPTDPFNHANIIPPTTIDELPEELRKLVEEKNVVNLQAALANCSMDDRQVGNVAKQFKVVNLVGPSTTYQ